jgi:hypothetical protein
MKHFQVFARRSQPLPSQWNQLGLSSADVTPDAVGNYSVVQNDGLDGSFLGKEMKFVTADTFKLN